MSTWDCTVTGCKEVSYERNLPCLSCRGRVSRNDRFILDHFCFVPYWHEGHEAYLERDRRAAQAAFDQWQALNGTAA